MIQNGLEKLFLTSVTPMQKIIFIIKKLVMNKVVNFIESILCLYRAEFLGFSQTKSFKR